MPSGCNVRDGSGTGSSHTTDDGHREPTNRGMPNGSGTGNSHTTDDGHRESTNRGMPSGSNVRDGSGTGSSHTTDDGHREPTNRGMPSGSNVSGTGNSYTTDKGHREPVNKRMPSRSNLGTRGSYTTDKVNRAPANRKMAGGRNVGDGSKTRSNYTTDNDHRGLANKRLSSGSTVGGAGKATANRNHTEPATTRNTVMRQNFVSKGSTSTVSECSLTSDGSLKEPAHKRVPSEYGEGGFGASSRYTNDGSTVAVLADDSGVHEAKKTKHSLQSHVTRKSTVSDFSKPPDVMSGSSASGFGPIHRRSECTKEYSPAINSPDHTRMSDAGRGTRSTHSQELYTTAGDSNQKSVSEKGFKIPSVGKVVNTGDVGKKTGARLKSTEARVQAPSRKNRAKHELDAASLSKEHSKAKADLTTAGSAINKGPSIGLSTRFHMGKGGLSAGPPHFLIGPGLNVGFGGGSSSSSGKQHGSTSGGYAGGQSQPTEKGPRKPTETSSVTKNEMRNGADSGQRSRNSRHSVGGSSKRSNTYTPHQGSDTLESISDSSFPHFNRLGNQAQHTHICKPTLNDFSDVMSSSSASGFGSSHGINRHTPPASYSSDHTHTTGASQDRSSMHSQELYARESTAGCSNQKSLRVKENTSAVGATVDGLRQPTTTIGKTNSGLRYQPSDGSQISRGSMSYVGATPKQSHTFTPDQGLDTPEAFPDHPFSHSNRPGNKAPDNAHNAMSISSTSGCGSTSRRNKRTSTNPPASKSPSSYHTPEASGSTHPQELYAWEAPAVGGNGKKDQPKRKDNYGEQLARTLSDKVKDLRPPKPESKRTDREKSEMPSTRKEAKLELTKQLRAFQKEIDDSKARKQGTKPVSGSSAVGGDKVSYGAEDGNASDMDDKPKEEPFGSKRNIHTLGCFQNESSKQVKNLRGKVYA